MLYIHFNLAIAFYITNEMSSCQAPFMLRAV
jgi:hypothetical protein